MHVPYICTSASPCHSRRSTGGNLESKSSFQRTFTMAPPIVPDVKTHTELLRSVLKDVSSSSKDNEVLQRIQKCEQLLSQLDTNRTKSGILSQFNLSGQVALVTGGGQGIGRAVVHALGEAGAKVAVADIVMSRAEAVVAELAAKGIEAIAIHVDVAKKDQVEIMIKQVLDNWGTLHIAFNNAGIFSAGASEEFAEADWARIIAVNLDGVFFCCQAEAKYMLKQGYGRIINVASIASHVSLVPINSVAYNASKAGCRHLTKTLGSEWASRGIRVNSISPVYIETPLLGAPELDALRPGWIADIPLGRMGEVEDLVGAVLYLASPACDFMTGADLLLDGGHCCW